MKARLYISSVFYILITGLSHSDKFADIRQQAEYWTAAKARDGVVCLPKADKKYKEFVKQLFVRTFGCGYTRILNRKSPSLEYELTFNNLILKYVSKFPVVIERNKCHIIKQMNKVLGLDICCEL